MFKRKTNKASANKVSVKEIDDDTIEVTSDGYILGAGVLPFTVTPSGEIAFLLGKELKIPGWKGSSSWSAFEGGAKSNDKSITETAAREYIEESLGVLETECSGDSINNINDSLMKKEYTLRTTLKIESRCRPARYHVTFVIPFVYDSNICEKFNHRRDVLLAYKGRVLKKGENLPNYLKNHAAVSVKGNVVSVKSDFLEKCEVKLFTLTELLQVVDEYENCKSAHYFRSCFIRTLRVILHDFKKNH